MPRLTTRYNAIPAATFNRLPLRDKKRNGRFEQGGKTLAAVACDKDGMWIQYTLTTSMGHGSQRSAVSDYVPFTYTSPQYGGRRLWFRCPVCGRRCGKLYLAKRTACRQCLGLVYPCQMASGHDKGWQLHSRWLSKIRDGRPRYMHWNTFYDLQEKVDAIATKQLIGISGMLEKMLRRRSNDKKD